MAENGDTAIPMCGHTDKNPVRITHADDEMLEIVVCSRSKCVAAAETREVVEMVFGPELEERRKFWKGLTKKERERIRGRTIQQMKKERDDNAIPDGGVPQKW